MSRPHRAGMFLFQSENGFTRTVKVEETSAAGRYCKELKMGGSSQCVGFKNWSGFWHYLGR